MKNSLSAIKTRKVIIVLLITITVITGILLTQQNAYAAARDKYIIKVNTKRNTVTAYEKQNKNGKKRYVPVRTMIASCGRATSRSSTTPAGRFKMSDKSKWGLLYGGVWGRYTVRFYRDYLFHTVAYRNRMNPASMYISEYKKLGRKASAGCVRMQFIDEKWLYDNCPKGTKVVVYKSSKAGPLGKPKRVEYNKKAGIRRSTGVYYDPTDPAKKNKGYNLKAPAISVGYPDDVLKKDDEAEGNSKKPKGTAEDPLRFTVRGGSSFEPLTGVKAKDKRTFQDLTSKVRFKVKRRTETRDEQGSTVYEWETADSIDTSAAGEVYRIEYECHYKYCSRHTGKKFVEITIDGNSEKEEIDDTENLTELIEKSDE